MKVNGKIVAAHSITRSPGELCTKIGTFPTSYEEVWILFLFTWKLPKAIFFSWLNFDIYLYYSIVFLVSKFYFNMFFEVMYSKLDFVSFCFIL